MPTLGCLNKKLIWVGLLLVCLMATQLSCNGNGSEGNGTADENGNEGDGQAEIIIPDDQSTIDAGIMAADDGDLILIRPGVYYENLTLQDKKITLASWYHIGKQERYIEETIIDGDGDTVIVAKDGAGGTKISGLTIRNGNDGINVKANIKILNCRFIDNHDGVDYEAGGGTCSFNVFSSNSDDGIDLDGPVAVTINGNIIQNNGDDGIEIRLHPYSGAVLDIVVSGNEISGNQEDGIQLIDYPEMSDRAIRIERNLIVNSKMAAIGFMGDGNTHEDFSGAPIPEPVHIFNNTLIGNGYGIIGGANVVAVNNIISQTSFSAMRNIIADSIVSYSLFWNNGIDYENSHIDFNTIILSDPLIDADYSLSAGSPAIDAGTATFWWKGETVLDIPPEMFKGPAPDIGAIETN